MKSIPNQSPTLFHFRLAPELHVTLVFWGKMKCPSLLGTERYTLYQFLLKDDSHRAQCWTGIFGFGFQAVHKSVWKPNFGLGFQIMSEIWTDWKENNYWASEIHTCSDFSHSLLCIFYKATHSNSILRGKARLNEDLNGIYTDHFSPTDAVGHYCFNL